MKPFESCHTNQQYSEDCNMLKRVVQTIFLPTCLHIIYGTANTYHDQAFCLQRNGTHILLYYIHIALALTDKNVDSYSL